MRNKSLLVLALAAIGLTGCYQDPFANPYQWSMNGAPRENLAQQVADPSELLSGHGNAPSNGVAGASAVDVAIGGAAGTGAGLQKPPPSISFSSGTGG